MNTIQIGDITREIPSTWDELTLRQVRYVARLLQEKISIRDFRVKLLFRFLKVRWKVFRKIPEEDIHYLSETLDFLTQEISLKRQLLPKAGRFTGPSDGMHNSSFGEFMHAHIRLEMYQKTKEKRYLQELAAILYRPQKVFWSIRRRFTDSTDPRRKFLEKEIPSRAGKMKKLSPESIYIIFLFFSGVFASMPGMYPRVFRKRSETGEQNNANGWISLVISLSDGKTDNDSLTRVMESNMYNVFFGLEEKAKQYEKHLEDMDKIRNK